MKRFPLLAKARFYLLHCTSMAFLQVLFSVQSQYYVSELEISVSHTAIESRLQPDTLP